MEIEGTDRSELAMARRRDWLINVAKRFGLKDRGWWGKWNVRSCRPCMSICISICTTYMYIHVYTYTYIQQRMYFLKKCLFSYLCIYFIYLLDMREKCSKWCTHLIMTAQVWVMISPWPPFYVGPCVLGFGSSIGFDSTISRNDQPSLCVHSFSTLRSNIHHSRKIQNLFSVRVKETLVVQLWSFFVPFWPAILT